MGIACDKARKEEVIDISKDEITAISDASDISKKLNSHSKELNCNDIRSRLHNMELELSSILVALKSTSDGIAPLVGKYYPSYEQKYIESPIYFSNLFFFFIMV